MASVFLCHAASPPVSARLASLFVSGIGVPLALVLLAVYLVDLALSVRSAIQIGDRLAKLHAIQDELTGRLEALKAEQQQAMELQRKRLEGSLTAACLGVEERAAQAAQAVQSKLEPLAGLSAGFAARLEAARGEAQQKLHALYDRQDFFERRLLRAFPSMRAPHYGDALKKLLEYRSIRKK